MKSLSLDLDQLAVDSFSPIDQPVLPGPGESEFTLCTACPTNQFSCAATCKPTFANCTSC